jgi:hypothetical protein
VERRRRLRRNAFRRGRQNESGLLKTKAGEISKETGNGSEIASGMIAAMIVAGAGGDIHRIEAARFWPSASSRC